MKYFFAFLISGLLIISHAQESETLLGSGEIESGGYGALAAQFTTIKGEFGLLAGAYGGWLINHTFLIGVGGYGLANNIKADEEILQLTQEKYFLKIGYGGIVLEYIGNSQNLIHYTIRTLIGAGNANYSLKEGFSSDEAKNSQFFAMQIDSGIEVNIVEYFRISLSGVYRFTSGVSLIGLESSDLNGFGLELGFRFGKF